MNLPAMIAAEIRRRVDEGALEPGDQLRQPVPPCVQLAPQRGGTGGEEPTAEGEARRGGEQQRIQTAEHNHQHAAERIRGGLGRLGKGWGVVHVLFLHEPTSPCKGKMHRATKFFALIAKFVVN